MKASKQSKKSGATVLPFSSRILRERIIRVARGKDPFISSDVVWTIPAHKSRSRRLKRALKAMQKAGEIVHMGMVSVGDNKSTMHHGYSLVRKEIQVPFE